MLRRRGLIGGVAAFLAMPSIIRTPGLLMPVKPLVRRNMLLTDEMIAREAIALWRMNATEAGDILFRQSDFPNADALAYRLKKFLPVVA